VRTPRPRLQVVAPERHRLTCVSFAVVFGPDPI
jgi:hypothetical protein